MPDIADASQGSTTNNALSSIGALRSGTVTEFSFEVGIGRVADAQGVSWMFHCTQIADGTRQIAVESEVSFFLAAGAPGRWEAFNIARRCV